VRDLLFRLFQPPLQPTTGLLFRTCPAAPASVFLPFLEKEFPQLGEDCRKRFADRAFVSKAYSKRISELMASLRKKRGFSSEFSSRSQRAHPPQQEAEQMKLFG
jgi:hypothetical protein